MMITEATRQYWLDTVLAWAESRLPPPQYDECKLALTTPAPFIQAALAEKNIELAVTRTEVRSLRATIKRVATLLPRWGEAETSIGGAAYGVCWNDLSAALHPPETPVQAAERVAEHGEETRLDLMQGADWLERD